MALSAVLNWFGLPDRMLLRVPPPLADIEAAAMSMAPPAVLHDGVARPIAVPSIWTSERLRAAASLWGEGFHTPGGDLEILRLAKPLGLSSASSLLLVGAAAGGPSRALASQLGVWVSGFENDLALTAEAETFIARSKLTKRAPIGLWNPADPVFRKKFHHHGIALEPLRDNPVEQTLAAIGQALKPGGHLAMLQVVADTPLDPSDPTVAHWARLDRRDPRAIPSETTITRVLKRLRFDVRVVEDLSERHIHQALLGWRAAVRRMEEERPARRQAMAFVQEAELWLFRLRLFQLGALRLVRWHGIGR